MARRIGEVFFFLTQPSNSRWPRHKATAKCKAAVLLEVVLALTLFVAAATVITGGLNASVREVERLRLNVHASNLAVSILSELQMGVKPADSAGPEPFERPFEMWTWQVQAAALDDTVEGAVPLRSIEVIVRHQTEPVVRRLTQFLPAINGPGPGAPSTNNPAAVRDNRSLGNSEF